MELTDRELIYVKTVVEEKSLTKAAQKLFIAQSSLSHAIQKIEETLGVKLFVRVPSGLRPNSMGEAYYKVAVEILSKYENLQQTIKDMNNFPTGKLSFGLSARVSPLLIRILPSFISQYPQIKLHIFENTNRSTLAMLMNGDIHFALLHSDITEGVDASLERLPIMEDEFVLVTSSDHPLFHHCKPPHNTRYPIVDLDVLKQYPIIRLIRQSNPYGKYEKLMSDMKIHEMNVILTTQTMNTALKLAMAGVGAAICFLSGVTDDVPESCILSLPREINPIITLDFVCRGDKHRTKSEMMFYDFIKEDLQGIFGDSRIARFMPQIAE